MAKATNTTTPSKFNKSSIMKRAWSLYRNIRQECERDYIASGFKLARFRNCLKAAWSEAKTKTRTLLEQLADLKYAHKLNQMSDNFYYTNGSYRAAQAQMSALETQITAEGRVAA